MNEKLRRVLGLNRPRLTLSIIGCAVALRFAFPCYVAATRSMMPTIPPGSYVVSMSIRLLPRSVEKNDVVVFKPVEGVSPKPWIHRIVANSGEKFAAPRRSGRVDISADGVAEKDASATTLVIPDSFVYQSGDSTTSYHGLVHREMVIGVVLFHFKLPWR